MILHKWIYTYISAPHIRQCENVILKSQLAAGRRRPIGFLKLQIIFCKRATNYRVFLRDMTCKDKASHGSSTPCTKLTVYNYCRADSWENLTGVFATEFQLQHTATHCNAMQYNATRCNTLQHTATHCNKHIRFGISIASHCYTLLHAVTNCNTLQHVATHCNRHIRHWISIPGCPSHRWLSEYEYLYIYTYLMSQEYGL